MLQNKNCDAAAAAAVSVAAPAAAGAARKDAEGSTGLSVSPKPLTPSASSNGRLLQETKKNSKTTDAVSAAARGAAGALRDCEEAEAGRSQPSLGCMYTWGGNVLVRVDGLEQEMHLAEPRHEATGHHPQQHTSPLFLC